MGIRVGTIVTRYDSHIKEISCESGELQCIGHITEIEGYEPEPDNPTIVVEWLHSCTYHCNILNSPMMYLNDQLWEIGQLN